MLPEGSDALRWTRMALIVRAEKAFNKGYSFDGWLENENHSLLDNVPERDLDAIFHLVWRNRMIK